MPLVTEIRDALRSFRRHRGVTLLAIGLLAVGVGSATAVFSIVNALWLRPLPMRDADALVMITVDNVQRNLTQGPFSWAAYQAFAESAKPALASITAFTNERFTLTGVVDPEQVAGARVSASFLTVLGVPMTAGRGFLAEEDQPGGPSVVVMGRGFWLRRFGGDPSIVGRTVLLNGVPFAVVGVLGAELPPPLAGVDVWTTKVWEISSLTTAQVASGAGYLTGIGRLIPGVSAERAQAVLDGARRTYAARNPANTDADPGASLRMVPFAQQMLGTAGTPLKALSGAVVLVVLIASANVAGLLLVRGNARRREWMIRAALGASRTHVITHLAVEAVLLAGAAAAASVLLAWWTLQFAHTAVSTLPRGEGVSLDAATVTFAAAAAVISAIAATAPAAWRAAAASATGALRADSRSFTRPGRTGGVLVAGEVTLAVVLLIAAVLLLRSLVQLTTVPLGYEPGGVLTMRITMPAGKYAAQPEMTALVTRLVERTRAVPGVAAASLSVTIPPYGSLYGPYQDAGAAPVPIGQRLHAQWSCVTPDYFATMRIPVLSGRPFSDRDTAATPRVVIVSRALAERLWPGRNAIGQRLLVARLPGPSEVVGVVGDIRNEGLDRPPAEEMYSPYAQRAWSSVFLIVRAERGDPLLLLPAVRGALHDVDPDLPPSDVRTAEAAVGDATSELRFTTILMAVFGAIAFAMAAAGLYAVIAYDVAQRVREIGIRVALGASRSGVLALVVGHALRVSSTGVALGLAAALALTRVFQSLLYGVRASDPITYVGVAVLFVLVSLAASALPAHRALGVNPVEALKAE